MNIALIFAGGTGQRMNSKAKPKQFLELNGKPIIIHTLSHFEDHPDIDAIVVVCLKDWIPYFKGLLEKYHIKKVRWVAEGGKTGQESIRNGLEMLANTSDIPRDAKVLIHDGVRPLINEELITDVIAGIEKYGNTIVTTPAIETIININDKGEIDKILDRSKCHMARAPQGFRFCDILEAHQKAVQDGRNDMVDSAMLMSHYGMTLHVVEGPSENIKITTPSDFYIFRAIFEAKENSQIWGSW